MNLRINHNTRNAIFVPEPISLTQERRKGMKKTILTHNQQLNQTRQKIIQLCFDSHSIEKFSPGLKMIYALNDPPLFVKLEKVDSRKSSAELLAK